MVSAIGFGVGGLLGLVFAFGLLLVGLDISFSCFAGGFRVFCRVIYGV